MHNNELDFTLSINRCSDCEAECQAAGRDYSDAQDVTILPSGDRFCMACDSQWTADTTQTTTETDESAIDEAMTAALIVLQDHLGVTDGGIASTFWDQHWNGFKSGLQAYLDFERRFDGVSCDR